MCSDRQGTRRARGEAEGRVLPKCNRLRRRPPLRGGREAEAAARGHALLESFRALRAVSPIILRIGTGAALLACPCGAAFYCGKDHQTSDWSQHKADCKRLRRAAAQAAAKPQGVEDGKLHKREPDT